MFFIGNTSTQSGSIFQPAMLDDPRAYFLFGQKDQWLFLVPVKGGRWHIIPQLAVYITYTTYILPSGGLYATYHLLAELETTIERKLRFFSDFLSQLCPPLVCHLGFNPIVKILHPGKLI